MRFPEPMLQSDRPMDSAIIIAGRSEGDPLMRDRKKALLKAALFCISCSPASALCVSEGGIDTEDKLIDALVYMSCTLGELTSQLADTQLQLGNRLREVARSMESLETGLSDVSERLDAIAVRLEHLEDSLPEEPQ